MPPRAKTSKYFGVRWYAKTAKYQAQVCKNYHGHYLGYHRLESDAAWAYDKGLEKYNLEKAKNFASQGDYLRARKSEMKRRGIQDAESFKDLSLRIKRILKIYAKAKWIPPPKPPKSKYTGVYCNRDGKYASQVGGGKGIHHYFGRHTLESDAAWAFDEGLEKFRIERAKNFASVDDYLEARGREMKERGLFDAGPIGVLDVSEAKWMRTPKPQKSNYTGVYYYRDGKYQAQVKDNRIHYYFGRYILESDAAWAYDKGLEQHNVERARNFASEDDYLEARDREMNERDLFDAGSVGILDKRSPGAEAQI